MKDPITTAPTSDDKVIKKKIPLLRKFDIPIDHLDFRYVEKCTDAREIERILRILRSGEEGHYPQLIEVVEEKLKELDPNSRVLRVEVPVLKSEYLDKTQREEIQNDLSDWIGSFEINSLDEYGETKKIFTDIGDGDGEVPIRGHEIIETPTTSTSNDFVKKSNPNRIKSWEYDKWDKLDIEAELTKLEVTDMQINEWEKFQKPKIQEEQKNVAKFMKNEDKFSAPRPPTKPAVEKPKTTITLDKRQVLSEGPKISPDKPSFIEELPTDTVNGQKSTNAKYPVEVNQGVKPRRRIRIKIDDVNMGY